MYAFIVETEYQNWQKAFDFESETCLHFCINSKLRAKVALLCSSFVLFVVLSMISLLHFCIDLIMFGKYFTCCTAIND